jgi:hypothetical protein
MRTFILFIALVTLMFSCGQNENTKKEIAAPPAAFVPRDSYPSPKELLFTDKRNENDKSEAPLYDQFYPIGWSTDGKFAYAEETAQEACCNEINIYIQDMNSDSILWKWTYERGDEDTSKFEKIWKDSSALFTENLNKYRVMPVVLSGLEKFPVKTDSTEYSFGISNKTLKSPDFGMTMLDESTISLLINGIEKKKIFSKKYAEPVSAEGSAYMISMTISDKIPGYLKSPYENRIALFYMTEQRGYEGPPNVLKFRLFGYKFGNE